MFGIPLLTLISYAVTYGPQAIKVIQALAPIIAAAEPVIAGLVKGGMPHDEATTTVFGWLAAPHKMTDAEREIWFSHQNATA